MLDHHIVLKGLFGDISPFLNEVRCRTTEASCNQNLSDIAFSSLEEKAT